MATPSERLCFTCERERRLPGSLFCADCQRARELVDEEPRRTSLVRVLSPTSDRRIVGFRPEQVDRQYHGQRSEDV